MPKQPDILEQGRRRRRIDARRKLFQKHKLTIILAVIGTIIAFLTLLLTALSYCGQKTPAKNNVTADSAQIAASCTQNKISGQEKMYSLKKLI